MTPPNALTILFPTPSPHDDPRYTEAVARRARAVALVWGEVVRLMREGVDVGCFSEWC